MKSIVLRLLILSTVVFAQEHSELVTTHVEPTRTPFFLSRISVGACAKIIKQGNAVVGEPDGLQKLTQHDLLVASDNLRACATTAGLARGDRDLAVGLYGETIAERSRRERR